ncbi:MAG: hypothetical protein JNM40_21195 [Myxococcales bacterium]|nr:hypothetical protein [Myxococcales bacterium]
MLRCSPSRSQGFRTLPLCALLVWVSGVATPARAQSTGIAADRMTFHSGPSAFYSVEGGQVAAPNELWLHSAASFVHRPLRLRQRYSDELLATPVAYRVSLDLGGELGLWKQRLAVGASLPVALWQVGDRLIPTGGSDLSVERALKTSAVGDIRLRAKARLTPTDWFWAVALALDVTIPGGGQSDFVATQGPTVTPRLIGWFLRGPVAASINVSAQLAPQRLLYDTTLHHSILWGAAVSTAFPTRRVGLALLVETVGSYAIGAPIVSNELRGGLRIGLREAALDLGGGAGFGPLSPDFRAFASIRGVFAQRPPSVSCSERPRAL